jgi:hypothetical protein
LRFVEDHYMVAGGRGVADALIPKMMDVLNEGLHLLPNVALAHCAVLAFKLVTRQGLLEHGDEGSIPRQKDGPRLAKRAPARGDIQSDKGLASAWYAGHEDNGLLAAGSGVLDDFLYRA